MRFKQVNRLFENYVRDDSGELWVTDERDERLTQNRRDSALEWLDKKQEEMLYHAFFAEFGISNKFEPGCARILSEMDFGMSMRYMHQIMTLRKIVLIINDIQSEYEKYDENLNDKTYHELTDAYETSLMIQQMRIDRRIVTREYVRNPNFVRIELTSYDQARTFARYMKSPWEPLLSERQFEDYRQDGSNSLFIVLERDFKDIEHPHTLADFGRTSTDSTNRTDNIQWSTAFDYSYIEMSDVADRLPNYDAYGTSMLLVVIDKDGRLLRCTGRYNDEFDYENYLLYLDEEELSLILGADFYEAFI